MWTSVGDDAYMYRRRFENTTFTRWVPETDIMRASPDKGTSTAADRRPPGGRRRKRAISYDPLTIVVQYRGGPEASWLVTARGRAFRFPGHMCLQDVLAKVVF